MNLEISSIGFGLPKCQKKKTRETSSDTVLRL